MQIRCNFDRFANNLNSKCVYFNSPYVCIGTNGVDSFNYNWGPDSINWLFPPPRLVIRAVQHLKACKGEGILVTPEWKCAPFYPFMLSFDRISGLKRQLNFSRKNIFTSGSDKSSHFGPLFNARINVWHLNFA